VGSYIHTQYTVFKLASDLSECCAGLIQNTKYNNTFSKVHDEYIEELAKLDMELATSRSDGMKYILAQILSIASFGVVVFRFLS